MSTDRLSTDGHNHEHHANHEHRGLITDTSELEPAQKLDPVYAIGGPSMKDGGPHNTHVHRGSIGGFSGLEAAEKLDPPDDVAARAPTYTHTASPPSRPKPPHQNSVLNMLDPDIDTDPRKPLNRADTEPILPYNGRYSPPSPSSQTTNPLLQPDSNSDDDVSRHQANQPRQSTTTTTTKSQQR